MQHIYNQHEEKFLQVMCKYHSQVATDANDFFVVTRANNKNLKQTEMTHARTLVVQLFSELFVTLEFIPKDFETRGDINEIKCFKQDSHPCYATACDLPGDGEPLALEWIVFVYGSRCCFIHLSNQQLLKHMVSEKSNIGVMSGKVCKLIEAGGRLSFLQGKYYNGCANHLVDKYFLDYRMHTFEKYQYLKEVHDSVTKDGELQSSSIPLYLVIARIGELVLFA